MICLISPVDASHQVPVLSAEGLAQHGQCRLTLQHPRQWLLFKQAVILGEEYRLYRAVFYLHYRVASGKSEA